MSEGYLAVTEVPGAGATAEQLAMLYTRYHLAAGLAEGGGVLEVACGPGMGLGYLSTKAKRVTGGDYDGQLLKMGRAHYGTRMPLTCLDAHHLPFRDGAFDLVILFEAIYYLKKVDHFLAEARRILRSGGGVLICSANKERHGFRPSPFSVSYFSASDLRRLLTRHDFAAQLYAAFPVAPSLRRNSRGAARWLANAVRLSPGAKALAKRILFGKPTPFPHEVTEGMVEPAELVPVVDDFPVTDFQVLYAIGRLR